MSLARLLKTPVTVQTMAVTGADAYGNDVWSVVASTAALTYINAKSTDENDSLTTDVSRAEVKAFFLPTVAIHAQDRVVDDKGRTWEVVGEPLEWRRAVGGVVHHIEVDLQRTS